MRDEGISELERKLQYRFHTVSLLETALTHSSWANERRGRSQCNERLEFLGDSVLGMTVAEHLYRTFPDMPEGRMTRLRAELVGDLAAEVLVGESSALYQRLYEQNLIDADFSCGFEQVRGLGLLELSGDSEHADTVIEAALQEAGRIAREGVDEAQLERLRRSMIGRRTRELDSFESTCYRMSAYFFEGAEYFDAVQQLRTITKQEIEDFLRAVVRRERMSVSKILPKEA